MGLSHPKKLKLCLYSSTLEIPREDCQGCSELTEQRPSAPLEQKYTSLAPVAEQKGTSLAPVAGGLLNPYCVL